MPGSTDALLDRHIRLVTMLTCSTMTRDKAARHLGISRWTLGKRLMRYGVRSHRRVKISPQMLRECSALVDALDDLLIRAAVRCKSA